MVTTPTVSDLVLDTTSVIISALVNVAKISSLPYLQGAASFALNITECIQHVRSNKEAFKRLADDACALVYVLHCAHEQATTKTLHPSFLQNTKELCQTLNEIDTYVRMHASKRMMLRIIQYKSDPGTIEEFRERLKHSLDIFGVKSSISIHDSLSSLDEKVTDLQTLVTQISEATRQDPSSMPPGGPGQSPSPRTQET
ncbi:hypothetical protein H0H92_005823 [Tricholoma furcatifolium]|nr:hypothetical protein H0H92_005823 [Tricholoma furcatifolium]